MNKRLTSLVVFMSFTVGATQGKYFHDKEQIKADFIERTVKMLPSREVKIRSDNYRVTIGEVDINLDDKVDVHIRGFYDLGRPGNRHVYLCGSDQKDCSKGGYCYAGYFPGPEIDKGIPNLKCKE